MPVESSLIAATAHPTMERALRDKLEARSEHPGSLGELEALSVRIGLIQRSLKPGFSDPQLLIFAGDHGLVVDGIVSPRTGSTTDVVKRLLAGRLPVSALANRHGLTLSVVDAGVSDRLENHAYLMPRKIAHGTRSCRLSDAMSVDQAHAAIRAGMEIADALPGNVLACAGIGVGGAYSAALVISQLSEVDVTTLMVPSGHSATADEMARVLAVLRTAQARHQALRDPVEVLAALGGFESAMLAGAMLVAASKRHLIVVDGMAGCAALMVAAAIAPSVTDYCVFSRSNAHAGLTNALAVFGASALLEMGMDCIDGTGAAVAWPLIDSAAALLRHVPDGDDPGPTVPEGVSRVDSDDMQWGGSRWDLGPTEMVPQP